MCRHYNIEYGVEIYPAILISCRDCGKYLCWSVDGFFVHKTIQKIWKERRMIPHKQENICPEVYNFFPIRTRSTE